MPELKIYWHRQKWILILKAITKLESEQFDDALKMMEELKDQYCWSWIVSKIAVAQAKVGKEDDAKKTFGDALQTIKANIEAVRKRKTKSYINDYDLKSLIIILLNIAEGQTEAGFKEDAQKILNDVLDMVEELDDKVNKSLILVNIAQIQAEWDEREKATKTFVDVIENAQKIETPDKAKVLRKILVQQLESDFPEQAMNTFELISANRQVHLLKIISSLSFNITDKKSIKCLLTQSAYYFDTAYQMCGLLARLYPEQAGEIAEKVLSCKC